MNRPALWLAAVLVVLGLVWIGQGIGVIPGSFMTGNQFWAMMGLILVVIAVAIFVNAVRTANR
jgi:uncharacterized membrane protein